MKLLFFVHASYCSDTWWLYMFIFRNDVKQFSQVVRLCLNMARTKATAVAARGRGRGRGRGRVGRGRKKRISKPKDKPQGQGRDRRTRSQVKKKKDKRRTKPVRKSPSTRTAVHECWFSSLGGLPDLPTPSEKPVPKFWPVQQPSESSDQRKRHDNDGDNEEQNEKSEWRWC